MRMSGGSIILLGDMLVSGTLLILQRIVSRRCRAQTGINDLLLKVACCMDTVCIV